MKKAIYIIISVMLLTLLSGCAKKEIPYFAGIEWTRKTQSDTEYICFGEDGSFSYYCACGNPVDGSDMCNGYTYNDKTITLKFDGKKQKITVEDYTADRLTLNFSGDIREFVLETEDEIPDSLEFEGETYLRVRYPDDVFSYADGYGEEDGEIRPVALGEWDLLMAGTLYVKENEREQVESFIADSNNYWRRLDSYNDENGMSRIVSDLGLNEQMHNDLCSIKEKQPDGTVFFEDIKSFATLKKAIYSGEVISAETELVWIDGVWYWRSGEIDESTEGWPEYIYKIPDSVASLIGNP